MEHPLISIVIPVYNGEKYLPACIDSILRQTWENWELLLIDDGSTDRSGVICDEYATKDARILVTHKKNGGQAAARNDGIAMARGEYVGFVDADDWLDANMYEEMLKEMESTSADIAICGFIEEYDGHQKIIGNDGSIKILDGTEALKRILRGEIGSYLWTMVFRKSVMLEPVMLLRRYEDHATIFKWVSHARKAVTIGKPFYHYRQLMGSSLHSVDDQNRDYYTAIKERYHYVTEHSLLPEWEEENRRLYLRGCIKLTKDMARKEEYGPQHRMIIEEVREELKSFLPIKRRDVGLKYYIRLQVLLRNLDLYVRLLRVSSVFSLKKKTRNSHLFK